MKQITRGVEKADAGVKTVIEALQAFSLWQDGFRSGEQVERNLSIQNHEADN